MAEAARLLALWEAAEEGPARGRAARLLAAAGEAATAGGDMPLGAATRRLLALRAALLGPGIAALAACPACGALNEAPLDAAELAALPAGSGTVEVAAEGWRAVARQPTLADLDEAAAACADATEAAALLRDRALIALDPPPGTPPGAPPPPALVAAVEAALDAADGLADPRIAGRCAGCGAAWEIGLDMAAFLAAELGARARQVLAEVATLARAFGWSEAAILALPPARRRAYLELAG